jgi:hypothetical protein
LQKEKGKFYGNALFCMLPNGHPSILAFEIPILTFFLFVSGGVGVGREDLPPKCDRKQLGPNPILYFIIHVN